MCKLNVYTSYIYLLIIVNLNKNTFNLTIVLIIKIEWEVSGGFFIGLLYTAREVYEYCAKTTALNKLILKFGPFNND